ncbi:hypothetical protein [Acetobacterium bakii]|uniref:DUF3862 domain-containing protein n=1 Tax=Acetobacterium bakii TaxID=52689 RepID=A0A0L6TVY8_9FIRM|nr:hypothetical protein [Acetobacterium bakii]KNZ40413.1 hypothetical protein AKG39_17800 [Acetobacterium bakii]
MVKQYLKGVLLGSILLAGVVLLCAGCGQKEAESTDPSNFYNKVQIGQTKEDAEKALGVESTELDKGLNYVDEKTAYGVTVNYDDGDLVVFKSLAIPDSTYLDGLSQANVTKEQAASITEGMTYDAVKTILGGVDGIEVTCVKNTKDPATPVNVMAWVNTDRSVVYVTFMGIRGTAKIAEFRQQ